MKDAIAHGLRNHSRVVTALEAVTGSRVGAERQPRLRASRVGIALWTTVLVSGALVAWGPGGIRPIASVVSLFALLAIALRVVAVESYPRPRTRC